MNCQALAQGWSHLQLMFKDLVDVSETVLAGHAGGLLGNRSILLQSWGRGREALAHQIYQSFHMAESRHHWATLLGSPVIIDKLLYTCFWLNPVALRSPRETPQPEVCQ